MVRCSNSHFICCVEHDNKWMVIDDLCDSVSAFQTMSHVMAGYLIGWFFGVLHF